MEGLLNLPRRKRLDLAGQQPAFAPWPQVQLPDYSIPQDTNIDPTQFGQNTNPQVPQLQMGIQLPGSFGIQPNMLGGQGVQAPPMQDMGFSHPIPLSDGQGPDDMSYGHDATPSDTSIETRAQMDELANPTPDPNAMGLRDYAAVASMAGTLGAIFMPKKRQFRAGGATYGFSGRGQRIFNKR